MVVFLSILVLKEKVGASRRFACLFGFVGVIVAANPAQSPNLIPAAMCVIAGFCWAWSTVLVRLVSRTETTLVQMCATSLLFALACAASFPWTWRTPDATGWTLMLGLGLVATQASAHSVRAQSG
jgi:S-adenosylmethionine uptake transporter